MAEPCCRGISFRKPLPACPYVPDATPGTEAPADDTTEPPLISELVHGGEKADMEWEAARLSSGMETCKRGRAHFGLVQLQVTKTRSNIT